MEEKNETLPALILSEAKSSPDSDCPTPLPTTNLTDSSTTTLVEPVALEVDSADVVELQPKAKNLPVWGGVACGFGSLIGTSWFLMPGLFRHSGILLGLIMYCMSGLMTYYVCRIMAETADYFKIKALSTITRQIAGKKILVAMDITRSLSGFLCVVSFQVVFANLFGSALVQLFNAPSFVENRYFLIALELVVVVPISFIRAVSRMPALGTAAAISIVGSSIVILIECFAGFASHGIHVNVASGPNPTLFPVSFAKFFQHIPLYFTCITGIHFVIVELHWDIKDPSPAKTRKMTMLDCIFFVFCQVILGVFGYLRFGQNMESFVLAEKGEVPGMLSVSQLVLSVCILLLAPYWLDQTRNSIVGLFGWDVTGCSKKKFITMTIILLVISTGVSLFTRNVGFVLSWLGAVAPPIISCVAPFTVYYKMMVSKGSTWKDNKFALFMFVFWCFWCAVGIVAMIWQSIDEGI